MHGRGGERKIPSSLRAVGTEPAAGWNSRTVGSGPEPKSDGEATEPPGRPGSVLNTYHVAGWGTSRVVISGDLSGRKPSALLRNEEWCLREVRCPDRGYVFICPESLCPLYVGLPCPKTQASELRPTLQSMEISFLFEELV